MSPATLVLGSWRLRHGEPAGPREANIALVGLGDLDLQARSLVLGERHLNGRGRLLGPDMLPLAVLAGLGEEAPIVYLVHGLETTRALFARIEESGASGLPLWRRIACLFEDWHLRLNNNECYYANGGSAETVHSVIGEASYWLLGWALHARLDEGAFPPFVPQFRVPLRAWHVDVEAFALAGRHVDGAQYALASRHARRRSNWDQRLVTVEAFAVDRDGTCRRHRRDEVDAGAASLDTAVATCAGAPALPVAAWRRLAFDIPCESLRTGNVFTVAVEDYQPVRDGPGRRVLARVRYEKTRGACDAQAIREDLAGLSRSMTACLGEQRVTLHPGREMLADAAMMREAA